eukprot:GHVH01003962.1.p1 GENE.GHVH01003962.1~~GHVH01003962.1.p1  ORF type:complete len:114 (-),score=16.73 GHVH01003962.1:43-384(-)
MISFLPATIVFKAGNHCFLCSYFAIEHGRRKLRTTRSSARSSARSSVKVYASYSLAKKTKKRKSHSYDDDDDDDEDDDGDDEAEGYEGYESENSNVQVIVLRGFTSLAFYLLF